MWNGSLKCIMSCPCVPTLTVAISTLFWGRNQEQRLNGLLAAQRDRASAERKKCLRVTKLSCGGVGELWGTFPCRNHSFGLQGSVKAFLIKTLLHWTQLPGFDIFPGWSKYENLLSSQFFKKCFVSHDI